MCRPLLTSGASPLQNHTAGIFITIMPGWLEGPVGLRDVVVGGNTFMSNEKGAPNVTVGQGTRNISLDGRPPDQLHSW